MNKIGQFRSIFKEDADESIVDEFIETSVYYQSIGQQLESLDMSLSGCPESLTWLEEEVAQLLDKLEKSLKNYLEQEVEDIE